MRILFVTEYFHPFVPGGTAWSLGILAAELVRRGEQVAVVTPSYGAPLREVVDGVPVLRFPVRRRLRPGASLVPVRDHVSPLFHLRVARAVTAAARALGADVVHAQEKHALVGAFLAARRLRRPLFLTLRDFGLLCPIATCLLAHHRVPADCGSLKLQRECVGPYLDAYIGGGWLRRLRVRASVAALYLDAWLKGWVLARADGVLGVSGELLEIYRGAGRLARTDGGVTYTAAPPAPPPVADPVRARETFGLPGDGPLVLFVGKRSPGKGFPVFLEAAGRVAARAAACFVVAGDGPPVALPAGVDVRLLGPRPHHEVETLYALADVVVHPAVWPEPFSRVPLEAAAAGTAIVATRTGGTPEAVEDKVTGLLVERRDAAALADAILTLLADRGLRETLGANARAAVTERFGPAAAARALLAAYARAGVRAS